jgi:hypothetical protein
MAYTIVAHDVVVHDKNIQNRGYLASSGTLTCEMNRAGKLHFTIPEFNDAYQHSMLRPLGEKIYVYDDSKYLWHGRVMEIAQIINGYVDVICEGWMSCLNDSVILIEELPEIGYIPIIFEAIINAHNKRIEGSKRFKINHIGFDRVPIDLSVLNGKAYTAMELIQRLFIYNPEIDARITLDKGGTLSLIDRAIDYKINQDFIVGDNILDFMANVDATRLFTVLCPIGANGLMLDEKFVMNRQAVIDFGRIYKTMEFPDITDKESLRYAAKRALSYITESNRIEFTGVDLGKKDYRFEEIEIGKYIHVSSAKHGIDKDVVCSKIVYNILDEGKNKYYLGKPLDSISYDVYNDTYRTSTSRGTLIDLHSNEEPIRFLSR